MKMNFKKPERHTEKSDELRALTLSDTHITGALHRRIIFIPGIKNIKKFSPQLVIFAGDCTDNGNTTNWNAFVRIVEKYCDVKNRIVAIGNHDTWISYSSGHDYLPAKENYLRFSNALMRTDNDRAYFRYEQKGYTFLVMGTEGTSVAADISEEQLEWLKNELENTDREKPVFVINHHPMNYTHGVGNNENGMGINGDADIKLKEILGKYKNIIYICGHIHFGFADGIRKPLRFSTVERIGENRSICVPCYEYGSLFMGGIGNPLIGTALLMDITDKKISLRGIELLLGREIKSFKDEIILEN